MIVSIQRWTLLCCVLLPLSVAAQTNITFTIEGFEGPEVLLGYHLAESKYVEDTLPVQTGGRVEIRYEESLRPGLYFLYSDRFYQEFIINEPTFAISCGIDGFESFDPEGSEENEVFRQFQINGTTFQKQRNELIAQLEDATTADSARLEEKLAALAQEGADFRSDLIASNPDLLVTKLLQLMQPVEFEAFEEIADEQERQIAVYEDYASNFRKRLDFQEPGLLRTPVFKSNVLKYFKDVIRPQAPDTLSAEIDRVLSEVEDDPVAFRYWVVTLLDFYQSSKTMGHDAVLVHILESYYLTGKADWVGEENLEKMREEVAFLKPNLIGKQAPPLSLVDSLGTPVDALALPEDYLVLFFYDPDCGHCKEATATLKEAYDDLRDQGAEVVAVCVPTDQERWKDYIVENDLEWVNLSDPYRQSNFRALYDVRSFPRIFIVGKERTIIAKRLGADQLVGFLKEYQRVTTP